MSVWREECKEESKKGKQQDNKVFKKVRNLNKEELLFTKLGWVWQTHLKGTELHET